jgi:hypothetical protein
MGSIQPRTTPINHLSKTTISGICLGTRGYVSTKQMHHSFTCDVVASRKKESSCSRAYYSKTFFSPISQTYTTTPRRLRRYDTWDPTTYKIVICCCVEVYDGQTRIGQILQSCYKLGVLKQPNITKNLKYTQQVSLVNDCLLVLNDICLLEFREKECQSGSESWRYVW